VRSRGCWVCWYADHPLLPLSNAVAMINMDMIGRMRDNKVYLGGSGSGNTLKATIEKLLPPIRS